MTGKALVHVTSGALESNREPASRLVSAFLSRRKESTVRAYSQDLEDFRAFVGVSTKEEAAWTLLSQGQGPANELAQDYGKDLLRRGLSPATVNRRLAALRSVVKLARTRGLVPWALDVEGEKAQSYRDTRGPGEEGFRRLLSVLDGQEDKKARRDRALLRLLYAMALRRGEVSALDLEDLDLEAGRLAVRGKGKAEKEGLTVPARTQEALRSWLEVRGPESGPLFVNLDRARKGQDRRLTGRGIDSVLKALGRKAGLPKVRPHGLRHAAITEALDKTGGNVREVQRFSRHADLRTLRLYDDSREDLGGKVSNLLDAAV